MFMRSLAGDSLHAMARSSEDFASPADSAEWKHARTANGTPWKHARARIALRPIVEFPGIVIQILAHRPMTVTCPPPGGGQPIRAGLGPASNGTNVSPAPRAGEPAVPFLIFLHASRFSKQCHSAPR
jgi:hypothetical protein